MRHYARGIRGAQPGNKVGLDSLKFLGITLEKIDGFTCEVGVRKRDERIDAALEGFQKNTLLASSGAQLTTVRA